MQESVAGNRLNQKPLSAFKPLFSTLSSPTIAALEGYHQAEFVGPRWLRRLAGPGLRLGGLNGWWGKLFDIHGQGSNLVQDTGGLHPALPVTAYSRPSCIDDKPCLMVVYPADARWPWPRITDELRWLEEEKTLLGMMIYKGMGLQRFAFPFLLHPVGKTVENSGENPV